MDWLMYIIMIILFAAVLVLLWKNYRIKKEAKLFAEKVEDALDLSLIHISEPTRH